MVTRSVLYVGPGGPGVPPHTHDGSEIEGTADLIHLRVDQLLAGTITGKEITVAGGAAGVIRSDNFASGVDGWAIFGDGSAEFNDVVVRGTIVAGTGSEVDWSYIKNVVIENADIVSLEFDKITAGSNTASLVIGAAGSISSANYVPSVSGWIIDGDGNAEFNDVTVRGDIISSNWDGTIPIDLSSYDVGATKGFALDSSAGAAQFMGDVFVGGDLRLRGGTARFGTGPIGGPRIDMEAGQSGDGEDNALYTTFFLTNVADPTINLHPSIAAFVHGRGTPGETNILALRSGAYGSDGQGHMYIISRSLDGSSNPAATVRIGLPDAPTRFAASNAAFFDDRTFFSDGSASQPAIAFQSDTATGLFWPSSGEIGVSLRGVESFRFAAGVHPSDNIFYAPVTGGPQLVADDSGTIPVFTFTNDIDTGMYRSGSNELSFATGGSQRVAITSAGHLSLNGALIIQDGSAANPGIRFASDLDTGMYRAEADIVAFTTGGVLRGSFQPDGFYATTPNTTGSPANLVTAGAGHNNFMRSTSARRYKTNITYDPEQLLAIELRPAKFYRPDDDAWYYGFIADDLAEEDPLLGTYDPDTGEIENYDQRAVMAVMAAKINELARRVRELEGAA